MAEMAGTWWLALAGNRGILKMVRNGRECLARGGGGGGGGMVEMVKIVGFWWGAVMRSGGQWDIEYWGGTAGIAGDECRVCNGGDEGGNMGGKWWE